MINYKRQRMFARMKAAALRSQANKNSVKEELVMSASAKVRAHPLYAKVKGEVLELWAKVRTEIAAGLTMGGIWRVIEESTERVVEILNAIEASGESKKEIAVLLLEALYEEEIKPVDLPWVPNAIEGFVDNTIGQAIRPTVSWLIDRICK